MKHLALIYKYTISADQCIRIYDNIDLFYFILLVIWPFIFLKGEVYLLSLETNVVQENEPHQKYVRKEA